MIRKTYKDFIIENTPTEVFEQGRFNVFLTKLSEDYKKKIGEILANAQLNDLRKINLIKAESIGVENRLNEVLQSFSSSLQQIIASGQYTYDALVADINSAFNYMGPVITKQGGEYITNFFNPTVAIIPPGLAQALQQHQQQIDFEQGKIPMPAPAPGEETQGPMNYAPGNTPITQRALS